MTPEGTGGRMRIVVYYAIWATICAAAAGIATALLHTWFFSYNPSRSAFMETRFGGIITALAMAAQGAVALLTGSILAQMGRELRLTVLLGLLIGLFDFVMFVLQMAVPATELQWVPDIIILVVATAGITAIGASRGGVSAPGG